MGLITVIYLHLFIFSSQILKFVYWIQHKFTGVIFTRWKRDHVKIARVIFSVEITRTSYRNIYSWFIKSSTFYTMFLCPNINRINVLFKCKYFHIFCIFPKVLYFLRYVDLNVDTWTAKALKCKNVKENAIKRDFNALLSDVEFIIPVWQVFFFK